MPFYSHFCDGAELVSCSNRLCGLLTDLQRCIQTLLQSSSQSHAGWASADGGWEVERCSLPGAADGRIRWHSISGGHLGLIGTVTPFWRICPRGVNTDAQKDLHARTFSALDPLLRNGNSLHRTHPQENACTEHSVPSVEPPPRGRGLDSQHWASQRPYVESEGFLRVTSTHWSLAWPRKFPPVKAQRGARASLLQH